MFGAFGGYPDREENSWSLFSPLDLTATQESKENLSSLNI
jgi:hypothetical protein